MTYHSMYLLVIMVNDSAAYIYPSIMSLLPCNGKHEFRVSVVLSR